MTRGFLTIETSLNGHRTILVDEELSFPVGTSVDRIRNFTLTTLIRISSFKRFESIPDSSVFRHGRLDIGSFKLRLIIVDVP